MSGVSVLFSGSGSSRGRGRLTKERNRADDAEMGAWKLVLDIVKTTMRLPRRIRAVCWITFWSWIGRSSPI